MNFKPKPHVLAHAEDENAYASAISERLSFSIAAALWPVRISKHVTRTTKARDTGRTRREFESGVKIRVTRKGEASPDSRGR